MNLPVGRSCPFGKHHYARVLGQAIDAFINALDCLGGIGAINEDVSRGIQRVPENRDFENFFFDEPAELYAQSFEMENARLPVRLNKPATMTGIPRIMVAIATHKPSQAMRIALNSDFIVSFPFIINIAAEAIC